MEKRLRNSLKGRRKIMKLIKIVIEKIAKLKKSVAEKISDILQMMAEKIINRSQKKSKFCQSTNAQFFDLSQDNNYLKKILKSITSVAENTPPPPPPTKIET